MANRTFCYLCGTATQSLHEGLCRKCFLKERELVFLPKRLKAKVCRNCLSFYSGGWETAGRTFDEALKEIAQKEVQKSLKHELDDLEMAVRVQSVEDKGKNLVAEVEVELAGLVDDLEYKAKLKTTLEIRRVLCPVCTKKVGGYYEAIIQLRGNAKEDLIEEVHSFLEALYVKDKKAFTSGRSKVRGGIDIRLGSAKAAKTLALHLKNQYGAEVKESATLVGRKEGKDVFRTTVLVRIK
jgi:nonsense-mediated mRNA decay protein 3